MLFSIFTYVRLYIHVYGPVNNIHVLPNAVLSSFLCQRKAQRLTSLQRQGSVDCLLCHVDLTEYMCSSGCYVCVPGPILRKFSKTTPCYDKA